MGVTRHGPVISDTYFDEPPFQGSSLDLPQGYAVSLAWQTLQPSTLVEAIIGMNRATTHEEFRAALSKWDVAGQNMIYADVEGNIGYQATGELPIRAGGDGSWPVPGWTGDHEWTGTVPFEEMPALFNPPTDYIATANNPVVRPGAGLLGRCELRLSGGPNRKPCSRRTCRASRWRRPRRSRWMVGTAVHPM